jgi:hypothetical protein
VITPEEESVIQVENLEVAQFVYLLFNNEKIRDVIDTIGKKAVLILDAIQRGKEGCLGCNSGSSTAPRVPTDLV